MLPTSAGVEPATSWSPVGWRIQMSHQGRRPWGLAWITVQNDFSYFWPTSCPETSYQVWVNLPFCSGKEIQNRFSRWQLWKPSSNSNQNDFGFFFFIYKWLWYFLPSFESTDRSVQAQKFKIDFQDGGSGGQLGLLIRTILAIFDLLVIPILPTKFWVNWPKGVGGVGI